MGRSRAGLITKIHALVDARGPPFSAFLYRHRNLVEGTFSKLKHFRAVAARFEKHSENYPALVKLASAKIWMRFTSR